MANPLFQSLSIGDQRDALECAASRSGRRAHLLEKDIAPDLVTHDDEEPLTATRNQERRCRREIETRLAGWVGEHALRAVEASFAQAALSAQVGAEEDRLLVRYTPLFTDYGFVQPEVLVEFGARSTGEPREGRLIACDAAVHVPEVAFPTTYPLVMAAERTFWEKDTAVHVFCRQQRTHGERLSRHWHDLVRLDDAGFGETALADRTVALSVGDSAVVRLYYGCRHLTDRLCSLCIRRWRMGKGSPCRASRRIYVSQRRPTSFSRRSSRRRRSLHRGRPASRCTKFTFRDHAKRG